MTTKSRAKSDDETVVETADEPVKVEEQAPSCGTPHFLPNLSHVTCTEPAPDPDLPPGTPEHEHRHQDGDAIYAW